MSRDHRGLDDIYFALYVFDRTYDTNYLDYVGCFTKKDNVLFKEKYGCYPMRLPICDNSLKMLEEFIKEMGAEKHFFYNHKGRPFLGNRGDCELPPFKAFDWKNKEKYFTLEDKI